MRDGFVRVAASTPDVRVADVKFNCAQIAEQIEKNREAGVKILVLPERLHLRGAVQPEVPSGRGCGRREDACGVHQRKRYGCVRGRSLVLQRKAV